MVHHSNYQNFNDKFQRNESSKNHFTKIGLEIAQNLHGDLRLNWYKIVMAILWEVLLLCPIFFVKQVNFLLSLTAQVLKFAQLLSHYSCASVWLWQCARQGCCPHRLIYCLYMFNVKRDPWLTIPLLWNYFQSRDVRQIPPMVHLQ